MVRPRLLALVHCLPYPPHSGVAARTYNILEQLQVAYDLDIVTFYRVNHQADRAARAAARDALRAIPAFVAEPTPIPGEHSTIRKVWDHARALISGRAYTYYQYGSRAFADRLSATLNARRPDLIHIDSLDLHRWLPALPSVPIACTHHDIDSELLRLRARRVSQPWVRYYLRMQAHHLEHLERELCPGLDLNVMMSAVDARRLQALAPGAATAVIPNGTDTHYFRPNGTTSLAGRVVFVGPTYSYPNRDAVEWLLRDIWPTVRSVNPLASLHLIGRGAPPDALRYNSEPGVVAEGFVPDIRPALSAARCCVVPIRVGSGTRLKILDAWAMGKAVVSTAIGCEGLDAIDGENILIRDTPREFADAVLQVLSDGALRSRLERNARRAAVERYSWTMVGHRLRSAYAELLGRSASGSTPHRHARSGAASRIQG